MKREIHRIDPWSAVRVGFFLGLFCGFLFGLFNGAIVKYLAGIMGEQMIPPDMMNMVNLSGGAIFALSIIMALISSLMFALFAAVAAVFYNIIAGLFGGLELTVTGEEPSREPASSHTEHDQEEAGHE